MSACTTKEAAIPLIVDKKLTAPLECNAAMEDFESYKKSVKETTEANLAILRELPPPKNFSVNELIAYLEKEIKCELDKDSLFENIVEVSKYAHSMMQSMEKYFNNIYKVDLKSKERNLQAVFDLSRDFLNSDLPERFLDAISTSLLIENDFTDFFDRRIRKEHLGLIATRHNDVKFKRICNEHNIWVREFTSIINQVSHHRTKLIWYIDINNSKSFEELFKYKYITVDALDDKILAKLLDDFDTKIFELETLVTNNNGFPCIAEAKNNDSITAFTEMMEIIGNPGR